jgi:hypothetical protein
MTKAVKSFSTLAAVAVFVKQMLKSLQQSSERLQQKLLKKL